MRRAFWIGSEHQPAEQAAGAEEQDGDDHVGRHDGDGVVATQVYSFDSDYQPVYGDELD